MQESLPERPENRSAAIVWLASPPGQVLKSATTPRLNLPYASRKRNSYETNVEKFPTTLPCSWGHSPEVWFGGSKALLKVCSSRDLLNPVFGQLPDCRQSAQLALPGPATNALAGVSLSRHNIPRAG
jgi:hypothetical protein